MSESIIAKYHKNANSANPPLSETAIVTPNDEASEACAGSINETPSKSDKPKETPSKSDKPVFVLVGTPDVC